MRAFVCACTCSVWLCACVHGCVWVDVHARRYVCLFVILQNFGKE